MLRKVSFPLLLLLLPSVFLAFGANITLFQASYDNSNAQVVWEVASEAGVQNYELYRKANNEPAFTRLTTVPPSGQDHYRYLDNDVYREVGGPFIYRLTVRTIATDQSYVITLGQAPSAMQRSWGSIKSMFR
jgi:hypothetical protein